jgi:hypothetical protein
MNTVRFDNSPLSFSPAHLFITKQDEVLYKLHIDGFSKGHIITRNDKWEFQIDDYTLTDRDKEFLIEAAKSLSIDKTPKEASTIFHNIIKASVSPKATGSKVAEKKEAKQKPKK